MMSDSIKEFVESKSIDEIAHHWKCNKEIKKLTQPEFELLTVVHEVYFEKTGKHFPDYNNLSKIVIIESK